MDIGQVFLCSEPSRVTAIITEIESCLTRAKKEARRAHFINLLHFAVKLFMNIMRDRVSESYSNAQNYVGYGGVREL